MAKSYGGITVDISGNYDNSDIQKAIRDLRALDNSATATQSAFGRFDGVARAAGLAIAGMTVAAGALAIKLGIDGVQAAIADQRAAEGLAQTMKNLGLAHDIGPVETFIDSLQRATGVADDQLRPAYDRLIRSIGDTKQAQDTLRLSLDIAAGTGKSLEAVAAALGKAYDGNTTALSRLGAGIDTAILKTGDMNAITQALSNTFGGQAATAANTYEGRIRRLQIAADELKEAFGMGLLSNIDSVFRRFTDASGSTGRLEDRVQSLGEELGLFLSGLVDYIYDLREASGVNEDAAESTDIFGNSVRNAGFTLDRFGPSLSGITNQIIDNGDAAENAADALDAYAARLTGLANYFRKTVEVQAQASVETQRYTGLAQSLGAELGWGAKGMQVYNAYLEEVADKTNKSGSASGSAQKSLKDLRDEFEKTFNQEADARIKSTLDTLKTNLDEAQRKFDQFRTGLSSSIFGQLDPSQAVDTAKETGGSIVDAFVKQAAGVQKFGEQLQALLQTNLSEEAFALVAQMSAEKGTLLASELLGANGQYFIDNFNKSVEAVKTVADLVGQLAAEKWYQAGVDSAQQTYDGFKANFGEGGPAYNAMQRVMNRLADSMRRETTITVTTINRQINEVFDRFGGPRAMGGPVSANTAYMVGERGPELFIPDVPGAIVPNHALGSSSGDGVSGGGTINLTVNAGMGTDGGEVGRQIVEALRQYQRRNGPVPITVA